MKYIKLNENIVVEIILEINPELPEFTLEQRYPQKFISTLIPVSNETIVEEHYIYNSETKEFSVPIVIEEPIAKDMESPIA